MYRFRLIQRKPLLAAFLIASIIFLLDQFTKMQVVQNLYLGQRNELTVFFNLVHVRNYGAAFSFLSEAGGWQRWFLTFVSAVASLVIVYWIKKSDEKKYLETLSLIIILGGALGNFYDRLILGYVIDFLDFHWSGVHFPAFNIADTAITIGATLFIADNLIFNRYTKEESGES
jgi:signal peptidase II